MNTSGIETTCRRTHLPAAALHILLLVTSTVLCKIGSVRSKRSRHLSDWWRRRAYEQRVLVYIVKFTSDENGKVMVETGQRNGRHRVTATTDAGINQHSNHLACVLIYSNAADRLPLTTWILPVLSVILSIDSGHIRMGDERHSAVSARQPSMPLIRRHRRRRRSMAVDLASARASDD